MPVRSRAAAICAASVFATTLVFGGTAIAADKPIRGTTACTQLVDANANVQTAEDNVDAAKEELARRINGNDTTANINAQVAAVTRAQNQLAIVRGNTTALLCQDAPVEAPVTTTPPVTTDPAPTEDPAPSRRDRDCVDFDTPDAAQAYYLSVRTAADPDPDRLDRNGNGIACEGSFGDDPVDGEPADEQPTSTTEAPRVNVNGNVTVNPTQDDGSVATTDGSQIEVTPEGSVSTGAA